MRLGGGLDVHDDEEDLQPLDVTRASAPRIGPAPEPPPAGRSTGARPAVAALIVMMLIAGVAGFAVTNQIRSGKDFNQAVTNPPATVDPDESALGDLNVQQTDVTAQYTVGLIPDGDSVAGTTLDLCNAVFPSERLRSARRQVAAVDTLGSVTLSTEAVLYRRPADAAQAFTELHTLARTCPNRPVTSPTGGTTVTTKLGAAPDRSWAPFANVERIAFDVNTTDQTGRRDHSVAVYLRRGRVLMGVYFATAAATQPMVAGETSLAGISRVFASRIAELPASVVNR
jgi:hypothetical protein